MFNEALTYTYGLQTQDETWRTFTLLSFFIIIIIVVVVFIIIQLCQLEKVPLLVLVWIRKSWNWGLWTNGSLSIYFNWISSFYWPSFQILPSNLRKSQAFWVKVQLLLATSDVSDEQLDGLIRFIWKITRGRLKAGWQETWTCDRHSGWFLFQLSRVLCLPTPQTWLKNLIFTYCCLCFPSLVVIGCSLHLQRVEFWQSKSVALII